MRNFLMLLSLCTVLVSTSCHSDHESEETDTTKFLVTSPLNIDTTITRNYVCQIKAIQHIELRALEGGYLQDIYVDEGQLVRKGQMMFQIMPLVYKAENEKAQAEANYAEIEYQNTKQLAEKNVVSPNELALAKAKLDKAKAELSLTQVRLGFTQIKAPFDGYMDKFQARKGSLLGEGDLLTTLSDNSEMWVYFNVPEAEYLNYRTTVRPDSVLRVTLMMANNQAFGYPGVVKAIEADFNNETGNIAFRATFPNPKSLLRHGETGNIQMVSPLKNAIIIPQKATFEVLEKKYIFVVDKDNIVHQREVTIAGELPDIYLIKSGLKPGEKIIYEGIRKVTEGQKITFQYDEPRSVISKLKIYVE